MLKWSAAYRLVSFTVRWNHSHQFWFITIFLPQIHPHGWCALSRNISYDESTEFTCLHDIQYRDYDESADTVDMDSDGSDQRKTLDATDSQIYDTPVASPTADTVETPNNDTQALNLSTSTSTSNVWASGTWFYWSTLFNLNEKKYSLVHIRS